MKYVYLFNEGNKDMREILGGKGANLAEMTNLSLPIPPGFTVSTEACTYYVNNNSLNDDIKNQIISALHSIEEKQGKIFGSSENPLLVSVRSGARVSMPGMMDTILNLGLNDDTVKALAKLSNDERFAYDSYRRFIQMYSNVVMGLDSRLFEDEIDKIKIAKNIKYDIDLTKEDLILLVDIFKKIYKENIKEDFPSDPYVQLFNAVQAVFNSWNNERAIVYRRMNGIPTEWGTAVNIQCMVYGNLGLNSGTGVAFTRNPSNGENKMYGEYLMNAQGEDVVAGVRTPEDISKLKDEMPEIYNEFVTLAKKLENHYKDMQDMEFTIENGKLYFLQTRNGKRTSLASINVACDLVDEGLITEEEALLRIEASKVDELLHKSFDNKVLENTKPLGKGLPASPGAASGKIVFSADTAKQYNENNEKVILVRLETDPDDIIGMEVSEGILTVRGGMTSHAAVVARSMGRCCITGCSDIIINYEEKYFTINGERFNEGDIISLDGSSGYIYKGNIPVSETYMSENLNRVLNWASKYKRLGVKANADNSTEVKKALELGAEGIGLCRTEHMFFSDERIVKMRKMILASNKAERINALNDLIKYQEEDFISMYKELKDLPMTVRYLDPPLHEFLPKTEEDLLTLSKEMNVSIEELKNRCDSLKEVNPMMGHRGCRLAITYPEIAEMQTIALIEASILVSKELNVDIKPQIMVPLVGDPNEYEFVKKTIINVAEQVKAKYNSKLEYEIGCMIEVPRAALLTSEFASNSSFFSYGTNDLTQMTYGFSRDDAGKFLESYYNHKVFTKDPFQMIDEHGVGKLMNYSVVKAKQTNKDIELGICGEHGGDPISINFFHKLGLDYVSCSPYRVPIAKIAAAQANINNKR